jgi:uncharacterized protein DUF4331
MRLPSLRNGLLLAGSVVALAVGASPVLVVGADHLDAPALGGLTTGGAFNPPGSLHSDHGDRDINDVYVFQGSNAARTVLAMTTNPAINFFGGSFGTNVRYILNVDKNGNAVQDLAYVFRFGAVQNDVQSYTVTRYTGANARTLRSGVVVAMGSTAGNGRASWTRDGTKAFAGVRSDPFFFDLTGFVGTVLGLGTDALGDDPTDFFAGLNTNAVLLEVPDDALGNGQIGVWGQTTYWSSGMWHAADQMGRPAINTVFNTGLVGATGTTKNQFNTTPPSQQRTAFNGQFRTNVVNTLMNINAALGLPCDDYDAATAGVIADILLPDVITYDTTTAANGTQLNGRALADDVIDAELGITTNGCATSDGVGAHGDYMSTFPYLGTPHP